MNLNGLQVYIGKGRSAPPDDSVIYFYPCRDKTPEEITTFLLKISDQLDQDHEICIYTMSPQVIAWVGGKDEKADYEDALVLCPKHPPTPLLDIMQRDYMAHFSLGDLYMRQRIRCPKCDTNGG